MADDTDDIEALAAEYVLGTLDADERRAAVARMAADPEFARRVGRWQMQLQPLAEAAGEAAVHPDLFHRIAGQIGGARPTATKSPAGAGANVVELRRTVRRWRWSAGIAAAAAVVLLAVVVTDHMRPPETQFVATLTPQGGEPAFVLTVDTVTSTLTIRRIAGAAPADKSYELWAVEPGQQPKSLGVVEQAAYTRQLPYDPNNLVFAISLEPKGGSPTGVATGPIVYSGPLVKSD